MSAFEETGTIVEELDDVIVEDELVEDSTEALVEDVE
jgi:hypothetical protein